MDDLYVKADTKQALLNALASISVLPSPGLVSDNEFVEASSRHALIYFGPVVDTYPTYSPDGHELTPATFLQGVYAAIRCYDDELYSAIIHSSALVVTRPPNAGTWA